MPFLLIYMILWHTLCGIILPFEFCGANWKGCLEADFKKIPNADLRFMKFV